MYVCFLSFATPPEKNHQYLLKEIKRKKKNESSSLGNAFVEETNPRREETNPRAKIKSTRGAHSGETAVTQSSDGGNIPVDISDPQLRQLAEAYNGN